MADATGDSENSVEHGYATLRHLCLTYGVRRALATLHFVRDRSDQRATGRVVKAAREYQLADKAGTHYAQAIVEVALLDDRWRSLAAEDLLIATSLSLRIPSDHTNGEPQTPAFALASFNPDSVSALKLDWLERHASEGMPYRPSSPDRRTHFYRPDGTNWQVGVNDDPELLHEFLALTEDANHPPARYRGATQTAPETLPEVVRALVNSDALLAMLREGSGHGRHWLPPETMLADLANGLRLEGLTA